MFLGVHVSTAGKIYEAVGRATNLGCNTMQIFARNPQQWRGSVLLEVDIDEFKKRRRSARIKPLVIHISYLINLASPIHGLYKASIDAYVKDIQEAQKLGAEYIVTHMGSHKNTSEEEGLNRLANALNIILEKSKGSSVKVLLENTSGSGSCLGYRFHHHKQVIDKVKHKERIGLCLDTAHAYLAGYDLSLEFGLRQMLKEIDTTVGLTYLKLIHLNDAKGKLGSRHDRHEHIGKGGIGLKGIRSIINNRRLRNLPFILETPKDSDEADKLNLNRVRRLRE